MFATFLAMRGRSKVGVASYRRGSRRVSEDISREARSKAMELLQDLNEIPKTDTAPKPFGPIRFVPYQRGWFAECPQTGHGYYYETLRRAVASWQVEVVSVEYSGGRVCYFGSPR